MTDRAAHQETIVGWISTRWADVRPGDVLLLPAEKLTENLADRAEKEGLAALILIGETVPARANSEVNVPIVSIPDAESPEETHRILLTALLSQSGHLTEWRGGIHQQLDRMVAEGEDLQGLARAMNGLSGRGVLVQDKRLQVLASSPSSDVVDVWDELLVDLADVSRLPEALRDRKEAGREEAFLTQRLPGELARLVTPITVGNVARGYLSLVGLDGDLDAVDQMVAEQGALACAVYMSRSKAIRETEKRLRGDLLTALLQGDLSPRDAQLWAEAMGVDLSHAHTALRFAWESDPSPSLRRLETLVNGEIARMPVNVIVDSMGGEVICFCQVDPESGEPKAALALGKAVIDGALAEDAKAFARCGIGSPANELSAWHTSFRQAGQALELASRLDADRPLYFPDLSVYRLLMQLEHSQELKEFESEILGKLADYDSGEELL
ncbi:MAG: hypothetical protein R3335_11500, partial [Anaerolineales bacterium]|nr:hypothetical protein [Anaerolineales bacterium]